MILNHRNYSEPENYLQMMNYKPVKPKNNHKKFAVIIITVLAILEILCCIAIYHMAD